MVRMRRLSERVGECHRLFECALLRRPSGPGSRIRSPRRRVPGCGSPPRADRRAPTPSRRSRGPTHGETWRAGDRVPDGGTASRPRAKTRGGDAGPGTPRPCRRPLPAPPARRRPRRAACGSRPAGRASGPRRAPRGSGGGRIETPGPTARTSPSRRSTSARSWSTATRFRSRTRATRSASNSNPSTAATSRIARSSFETSARRPRTRSRTTDGTSISSTMRDCVKRAVGQLLDEALVLRGRGSSRRRRRARRRTCRRSSRRGVPPARCCGTRPAGAPPPRAATGGAARRDSWWGAVRARQPFPRSRSGAAVEYEQDTVAFDGAGHREHDLARVDGCVIEVVDEPEQRTLLGQGAHQIDDDRLDRVEREGRGVACLGCGAARSTRQRARGRASWRDTAQVRSRDPMTRSAPRIASVRAPNS